MSPIPIRRRCSPSPTCPGRSDSPWRRPSGRRRTPGARDADTISFVVSVADSSAFADEAVVQLGKFAARIQGVGTERRHHAASGAGGRVAHLRAEPTTKWGAATSTFTFPLRRRLTMLRIPNDMYSQSQFGWHFQNLAAADEAPVQPFEKPGRTHFRRCDFERSTFVGDRLVSPRSVNMDSMPADQ